MLNTLNEQLAVVKEKLNEKRKLDNDIFILNRQISSENIRKSDLKKKLAKESADVKKLEGLTLTALFQTILGSKEQQLEKERQEYLRAKLNYDECDNGIAALIFQNSKLRTQLKEFDSIELDYRLLLKEKEDYLLKQPNSENARQIFILSEQIADKTSELKELNEAIQAGKILIGEVENTIYYLQKAKNWGTWDMLGGGIIATSIKHSHIDASRNASHKVQQAIRNFERELRDVNIQTNISTDISGFLTFSDYFFDGLIVDWLVQDKIKNALNRAYYLSEYAQNLVWKLENDCKTVKISQEKLYQNRLELIEKAK
jgi:hypothetical protein